MIYDLFYASTSTISDKEWNEFRSRYPLAQKIENVKSFEDIKCKAFTKMFWVVWSDLEVNEGFEFDYEVPEWDLQYIHVFKNGENFDGITIFPKNTNLSSRELDYRFYLVKKEIDIQASTPKQYVYDIVFISYNEENADKNYEKLLKRFPRAKRVHGVKGIHNAHVKAAELCDTDMIWIVDGDAEIVPFFKFDHKVSPHEKNTVHVWRSKNPINGLTYGYGGVKLLPRVLTLNMDTTTPDMTTAISNSFKAVQEVSNITAFNTDAFSAWRSAFRECVKLSSKVITRQNSVETDERLDIWCTTGADKPYGKYAIAGAIAGRDYGERFRGDKTKLALINDFEWLERYFEAEEFNER